MSHFRTGAWARAAMVPALILPALSACANQSGYIADDQYYYADLRNPVPEVSGQKIGRFETRVYANAANPHPELMGSAGVRIANASAPTPTE